MNEAPAITPAPAGEREPSPALPGHKGSEQMNHPAMSDTEIAHLRTLGTLLAAVRAPDEHSVVVSFSARQYDADTADSSVGVTVSKGGETETAHAAGTDLATAMLLARGACDRKIKAKADAAKKNAPALSSEPSS